MDALNVVIQSVDFLVADSVMAIRIKFECDKLDISNRDMELKNTQNKIMQELKHHDDFSIILDMSKVLSIDSSGIGVLLAIYRLLNKSGVELVLDGVQKQVKKALDLCKANNFFRIVS